MRFTKNNALLWTVQGLLAALFLFAGVTKVITPMDVLAKQSGMPGPFLLFIGAAELAGGLGLILPGVTRIWQHLTSLAAAGLVIIMIGATVLTLQTPQPATALIPAVVGVLSTLIAIRRRPERKALCAS